MHKLLVKLFIKDYQNINDLKVRANYGKLAGGMGIISNLFLAALKIILGIFIISPAVIADGINNLSDGASSIITLIGFKLSSKEADSDHPFGHQRLEYVTGLIVAFIIMLIGFTLGKESLFGIIDLFKGNPKPLKIDHPILTISLISFSIIVKLWQASFYRYLSKEISSTSLKASSKDSLNDCITSFAILLSTIIFIVTKEKVNIDSISGMLVSIFIILTSVSLIKETIDPLLGITPTEEEYIALEQFIKSYDGVLGIHDLVYHSYGQTVNFVTVHVEVSREVDVMESHDMIDNIEHDAKKQLGLNLTIHMDPIEVNDELTTTLKQMVKEVINKIDPIINFHDFRIVKGITHTNILFDVVIPFDYKLTPTEVKQLITSNIALIDSTYRAVIEVDQIYVHN